MALKHLDVAYNVIEEVLKHQNKPYDHPDMGKGCQFHVHVGEENECMTG